MLIRNTMLYRRFWYIKKRHKGKIRGHILFMAVIIILYCFVKYATRIYIDYIDEFSEYKIKSVLNVAVFEAIENNFSKGLGFEDLIKISKDKDDKIKAVSMNSVKANELAAKLSSEIQRKINSYGEIDIKVPVGALFGDTIFYNIGPDINIALKQIGNVETHFLSEFTEAGINQTKHSVKIVVKADFALAASFIRKKCNTAVTIPIMETVIVGDTPNMYLNLQKD